MRPLISSSKIFSLFPIQEEVKNHLLDKALSAVSAYIHREQKKCDASAAKTALILFGNGNFSCLADAMAERLRKSHFSALAVSLLEMSEEDFLHLKECGDHILLVDCLFGSKLPQSCSVKERIDRINASGVRILSMICPFGVDADTGGISEAMPALCAHATVTLGFDLPGQYLYPGAAYVGELLRCKACKAESEIANKVSSDITAVDRIDPFPARPPRSHKGSCGTVCIIGGKENMAGAVYFSGMAAYRTGAGLVRILTHEKNREILQTLLPEAVLYTYSGSVSLDTELDTELKTVTEAALTGVNAAAIGPGLGQSDAADALFAYCFKFCDKANLPLVIDADGLNLAAKRLSKGSWDRSSPQRILTPHPGEMARLYGGEKTVSEILSSPFMHCKKLAERLSCICLLKDAHTVISDGKQSFISLSGSPALSTAGSGDCLTGIIAGLLASGESPMDAAVKGAFLHGKAGEIAEKVLGERSVMARDILNAISDAIFSLSE